MKRSTRVVLVAWLLPLLSAGCRTGGGPAAFDLSEPLAGREQVVLSVGGLCCPLCGSALETALRRQSGVEAVQADVAKGDVEVRLAVANALSLADLEAAVRRAGFALRSVKAVAPSRPE